MECFSPFLKLRKWQQIVQSISNKQNIYLATHTQMFSREPIPFGNFSVTNQLKIINEDQHYLLLFLCFLCFCNYFAQSLKIIVIGLQHAKNKNLPLQRIKKMKKMLHQVHYYESCKFLLVHSNVLRIISVVLNFTSNH